MSTYVCDELFCCLDFFISNDVICRYAYLEYANEKDAYDAAEKYKDMEIGTEKLYIIKAIVEKKEKYGNQNLLLLLLLGKNNNSKVRGSIA